MFCGTRRPALAKAKGQARPLDKEEGADEDKATKLASSGTGVRRCASHASHPRKGKGGGDPGGPENEDAGKVTQRRCAHVRGGKTGNDPSAGSPTETLLRLLLPLNDKVWTASRGIAAGEPAALPQSGGLTGSFNR